MEAHHFIAWALFLVLVLFMLALDLFVLHRKPHTIHMKEALLGASVPVVAALLFIVAIYFIYSHHFLDLGIAPAWAKSAAARKAFPQTGGDAALMFLTGYLVELSLSADNVFLFVLIMAFFKVPRALQYRVLFWGVLGALLMRGVMIMAGAALLSRFEWVIYLFGGFLLIAGIKMLFSGNTPADPSNSFAVRSLRKIIPIHDGYDHHRFFTKVTTESGVKRVATTLFVVLVCIEFTDLVFAMDSIPAIFGITRDPFIVFTSNVFAILGLRSMYFLLAGIMDKFHFLKYGLAMVLTFVGVKMLLPGTGDLLEHFSGQPHHWEVDKYLSLLIVVAMLGASIGASLIFPKHHAPVGGPGDPGPHAPDGAAKGLDEAATGEPHSTKNAHDALVIKPTSP